MGPETWPRNPHVPVDRFLRKPLGNGARGWARRLGLATLTCPSIGFFGSRSAMAREGGSGKSVSKLSNVSSSTSSEVKGQRRAGVEIEEPASVLLGVSFSTSSEVLRQRRPREETDIRLRALSRWFSDLLGDPGATALERRDQYPAPSGIGQPASRRAGKPLTRTRIPREHRFPRAAVRGGHGSSQGARPWSCGAS